MSYAGRKSRIFRDDGDIPDVIRRRSEGRLKSYPSAQDARAWINDGEERRQQILDLINSDIQKCSMGKYVPIDVLINTLLANKNAELAALQKLLDIYSKLELTEDQKRMLNKMKQELGEDLESIAAGRSPTSSPRKGEDERDKCAAVKREREGSSCSALQKAGQSKKDKGGTSCAALERMSQGDLRALVMEKDAEIAALKKKLEMQTGAQLKGPDEPCIKEIEGLEAELQRLKSKGQLSVDDEAEIIRKEIEVLKRYCTKLSTIEEENKTLRNKLGDRDSAPTLTTSSVLTTDDDLRMELNSKIAKLNEVIAERDRLKNRIDVLERELIKYADLPEEIDDVKRKAETMVARSITSADKATEVDNAQDVQREIDTLKEKADQAGELQSKLEIVNNEIERVRRESAAEIEGLKLKQAEIANKRKFETDDMHKEMVCLSKCAQEARSLRRERDDLKSRLSQLCGLETQFKKMQEKVKYLESIKKEREMYKMRYEELLGLECQCEILKAQVDNFKNIDQDREGLIAQLRECECCIADQEEEIKRLIAHIDRMSEGCNEQQGRTHKKISCMKTELNQKNALISKFEERLTCVQEQLKNTIKGVTCETLCLRKRIAELEQELALATEKTPKTKVSRSKKCPPDSDEHFNEMLRQSKHAVNRVSEELEKHYKEWDSVKERSVTADQEIYDKYANEKRTNAELLQKIDTLQEKLDESNALNTKLINEAQKGDAQLKIENTSLRRYSIEVQESANGQIKDLRNALDDAQKQISQLVLENKELDGTIKQYKEKLAQPVDNAEAQVSGEIDALIDQNKQLLKDKLALQCEIDTLKQQLENYKRQLDGKVSGDNDRQMQEKLCMQDIIRQLQAQIAAMEARDLDSQQRQGTAIPTREIDSATVSPTLIEKQLQIQADSKSAAVDAADKVDITKKTAERGLITDEDAASIKLKSELREAKARAETSEETLKHLQATTESSEAATSDIIANLKSQLKQAEAKIEELEAKLKRCQTGTELDTDALDEIARLKAELEKERSRKAKTESQSQTDLQKSDKELQTKLKSEKGDRGVLTDESDATAKLKSQLEKANARAEASEANLKTLQAKVDGKRTSESGVVTDSKDEKAKLKSQIEKPNARDEATEANLKTLQAKVDGKRTRDSGVTTKDSVGKGARGRGSQTDESQDAVKLKAELEKANARANVSQANLEALQAKVDAEAAKPRREDGVVTDSLEKPQAVGATETEVISKERTMQTAKDPALALLEESNEKIKKLEGNNRDLRNSQQESMNEASALRRASKESDKSHLDQIRRLSETYEGQLKKSQMELERVSSIKNYQEKEIKNLQKRYSDGIAKLQGSHEEVIKEINVEHEKEVDMLRSALRASKEVIAGYERRSLSTITEETSTQKLPLSSETVEGVAITPSSKTNVETWTQGDKICKCLPSLREIAKKILKGGMEMLDFVDLKMLHDKTCEATAALLGTSAIQYGPCACRPNNMQLPEDKQILLKKINSLENELFKKQKHTQQKIGALQISVKMERERLQEFKALLDTERNRNNELMCKIGAQSRIVASMQAERDTMRRKSSFNDEKMQSLMMLCEQENAKMRQLEDDLRREREMRKRDAAELLELQRKQFGTPRGCKCTADASQQQTSCPGNQPIRQRTELSYHVQPQYSPHELINGQTFSRQSGVKQIGQRRRRSSLSPETKIKSPADLEDID